MYVQNLPTAWRCGRFLFDWQKRMRPLVMGILNTTPDSFSDGGRFASRDAALRQAEHMITSGVDIIDIGGESTRPGAEAVALEIELERVLPIIEALRDCGTALSIDTYKPQTMIEALKLGVDCVNDVWALRQPGALAAVHRAGCGVVLMHMQRDPQTMQFNPEYVDVVADVRLFLAERAKEVEASGVSAEQIILDPGFGFGKNLEHNLRMLREFGSFTELGYPVLLGISRKSMLGKISGKEVHERLAPGIAATIMAVEQGAAVVRTHDVPETFDALRLWEAARVL